jgi:hypothetical protein
MLSLRAATRAPQFSQRYQCMVGRKPGPVLKGPHRVEEKLRQVLI